jgi:hypothetical protein
VWVNATRHRDLTSFGARAKEYYQNATITWPEKDLVENDRARSLRQSLNRDLAYIESLVSLAGVSDKVSVREAPMLGGHVFQGVPLLSNMFNIHMLDQEPQSVFDFLDRAIGVLEHDRRAAWVRTFNPFFWIGLFFSSMARVPFLILGELGFDRARAERSLLGRLFKALIWMIGILGSLATLIEFSELGNGARAWLRSLGMIP